MMEAPQEDVATIGASSGIEGQELKVSEEAVAFMSSIEPQKCVFVDSLVTVSEGGRDLGKFSVQVEFGHRVQQPCLLLHAQSHGAIDDCPCGTTVTAYLTPDLEVLEEDFHEYVKDKVYPLNSQPVGICLIINNVNFTKDVRSGSDKDAQSLAEVFSELGFRVLMCKNQTKKEMEQTLTWFSSLTNPVRPPQEFRVEEWSDTRFTDPHQPLNHGDAFICCLLSHGVEGAVLGTDGSPLSIKHITRTFKATGQSPLKGKPKVFLIQACQGNETQRGVLVDDLEEDSSGGCSIPEVSDILVAISTVEGYVSFRHPKDGTWFIQSVCQQLRECCPRGEDLLTILTNVNNDVSKKEGSDQPGEKKQMSEVRLYTMGKKLVFSPRHT